MKLSHLLPVLLFPVIAHAHGPGMANDFGGKRVLLIGIDGCRADAVKKLTGSGRAPNLNALIQGGTVTWNGYAGGEAGSETEQSTSSGPGWTTILTGTWRDHHGVADNRFAHNRIAQWPHFMLRLKQSAPKAWTASFCDWPEIHRFIVADSREEGRDFLNFEFLATPDPANKNRDYALRDAELTARAVEHLGAANPDAMFVYFGQVDEVGHAAADANGQFSPDNEPYLTAIEQVDKHIGSVLSAVQARPRFAEEDWLILATTDHGGRGTSHGGQSPEERTIWMIANGGSAPHGKVLTGPVPQAAIAPTVFRHLGVPAKPEWDWAAQPFALSEK